jgi:hypothetical protein
MSDVQTWNVSAGSNNSAAPNGFPEGMPPSGVNDAAREVMAAVARYRSDTDGVNSSTGTNTITLAASRTMTAYAQGDLFTFKAGGTNTGATTLNVDSLGAKNVYYQGAALTGGEITNGQIVTVVYDGTQFQLINPAPYTGTQTLVAYKQDTDGYNTTTGTNTIALGASQVVTAYAQGDLYTFKAGGTNTGATTLNVDALGAKNVFANGAACVGGEIINGEIYTVVYDGTQFRLLNPSTYLSRAWINFNGTGTVAVRGSGNVTSLTDNGTGDYTVNFTTAMPDANFAVNATTNRLGYTSIGSSVYTYVTGNTNIVTRDSAGVAQDAQYVNVSVFR